MENYKLTFRCVCNYTWVEYRKVIIDCECDVCGLVCLPKEIKTNR